MFVIKSIIIQYSVIPMEVESPVKEEDNKPLEAQMQPSDVRLPIVPEIIPLETPQEQQRNNPQIPRPRGGRQKKDLVSEEVEQGSSENSVKQSGPNKLKTTARVQTNKIKKPRKIRTLIDKDKLMDMNKVFGLYHSTAIRQEDNKPWTLKLIAEHLHLGYSTILHKYRQFRQTNKVKAGALVTSSQKKRKYNKSLIVEGIIRQAMQKGQFFTASDMTNYIEKHYNKKFSRSIISRHLGDMGYSYKNLSQTGQNAIKYNKIRLAYIEVMRPIIQRNQTLIFMDELTIAVRDQQGNDGQISILIVCTIYGILYFNLQEGFFDRLKYFKILEEFLMNLKASPLCKDLQGDKQELLLVTDMSFIHRDELDSPMLANMLIDQNAEIYYIPPFTPQFNPIEPIFSKIKDIVNQEEQKSRVNNAKDLWELLQEVLQTIKQEPTEDYLVAMWREMRQCAENQEARQAKQAKKDKAKKQK